MNNSLLLETVELYAQSIGDDVLRALLAPFKAEAFNEAWDAATPVLLENTVDAIGQDKDSILWDNELPENNETECLKDHYDEKPVDIFVDDVEASDIFDVTGLESNEAVALANKLRGWNGKSYKPYNWRNGKRYLNPSVSRICLTDELVQSLPGSDDIKSLIKEKNLEVSYV